MITIKEGNCIMCATCAMVCPVKALATTPLRIEHYPEKCIDCAMCVNACPVKAITLHKGTQRDFQQQEKPAGSKARTDR